MFTLRKLKLDEGKHSALGVGHTTSAPHLMLIDWENPDYKKVLESIKEIEVGKQVIVHSTFGKDYHRTSKISEILSKRPGRVVFKTQTSVYELLGE